MSEELLVFVCGIFVISFVGVMLAASRRRSVDSARIELRAGEAQVAQLSVDGRFSRSRITLTTHRVLLQEVHWFLASTRQLALPLERLDGSWLRHRMNPWVLLLGLVLFSVFAPAGLLVVLYALIAVRNELRFGNAAHRATFSLGGGPEQVGDAYGFLRAVQRQHAVVLGATPSSVPLD